MLDFMIISAKKKKTGQVEIYPRFVIKKSSDLMIRGGDFYAIWVEERGLWSTDEQDALRLIDKELKNYKEEHPEYGPDAHVKYMWDAESGMIDSWHKYCQRQMRDNFHMLDEKLIFSNDAVNKKDYSSKHLNYPLEKGDIKAWDRLIGTLYSEEEREKIEWCIGSIVSGDSKTIQKFMVLYGSAGTGKSTILNVIQQLFDGYYSVFDAKALGSSSNSFALEAFKGNPLVAIQHDGDLSKIEDNARLNSLVSHELMTVNEKFKSTYSNSFKCFLFMGTNRPVKITDAKSGLIRRLIDVSPSGNKLSAKEYKEVTKQIKFELGAIAYHCRELYLKDPNKYDSYIPISMMGASNDFYNYILDCYYIFKKDDGVSLKAAWELYKKYCEDAKVSYPMSQRVFKEELKNYFKEFKERGVSSDGETRIRNYYSGFRTDKFEEEIRPEKKTNNESWIDLKEQESIFDKEMLDCPAQYANDKETPLSGWDKVKTNLLSLNTKQLHYVRVPENHIVIDFDIPDKDGNKNFELNLEAASSWPPTYAELSKGGAGIHLHYIYTGDVSKLSRVYDDHIEIKVFSGKSSLRRKLIKCNDLPISKISSGLPLKGDDKMVSDYTIKDNKDLQRRLTKALNREVGNGATKPSIDYINMILNEAYNNGIHYDVTSMKNAVMAFAAQSTHQSDYCMKLVAKMPFKSEDTSECFDYNNTDIVFYDIEVFPNLFLVNYKVAGDGKPIVRLINPKPTDIEDLIKFRLVGFNCRRYDNHIMWARMMGYTNEQLYRLSQRIINSDRAAFFGEAYNLSYTDVYDFASAANKKSLKKLEIEMSDLAKDPKSKMNDYTRSLCLKIKHHELGLPWDQPVPEELWPKVAEYCDDDVYATEAAFNYLEADWMARQILADLAEASVNDTTNSLTTKIIFGNEKKPQSEFNYRNLAEPVHDLDEDVYSFLAEACPEMMSQTHGEAGSLLPYFPGYKYERGKSTYRGEEVGEGGYVYAEEGMHVNVALLDITSMHPHSTIAECLFGIRFTTAYRDIVEGRVSIKHEAWDIVNGMLDGKLTPFIQKVIDGQIKTSDLANALKTAINSVYGLTAATFDNAFKDPRNIDNIVAKRGALFMIDLKHAVQEKGFTVAHIKTDSIKIPNATPEIIQFVMDFGKKYGYNFEHEATYGKMCLVNNAVYIAKYKDADKCKELYGYIPGDNAKHGGDWTATGKQFAVPYVYKSLFTKEPIVFTDLCETFSVSSSLYLDCNESLPDVSAAEKSLDKMVKEARKHDVILDISGNSGDVELDSIVAEIAKGHDYHFVGKVGSFAPIKPGCGGGILCRESKDKDGNVKYTSATGAKDFRWLESDMVDTLGKYDDIDKSYYEKLANDAIKTISEYGDYNWFVSDDS